MDLVDLTRRGGHPIAQFPTALRASEPVRRLGPGEVLGRNPCRVPDVEVP